MAEVCTPPAITIDPDGTEWVAFSSNHSISDICRWLMKCRADAEEAHRTLGEMLAGIYGLPRQ